MSETPSANDEPIIAIIDSNIIHGVIVFEGQVWEQISEHQRAGRIDLYFPEVVLEELTRQRSDAIREVAERNIRKFEKTLRELKRAKAAFDPVDLEKLRELVDVHMNAEYVTERLRESVVRVGGTILPTPHIDAAHLASAAIGRHKPFKAKGEGVGDYLIWRTVVAFAQRRSDAEIYFVSNNYKDFSVSDKEKEIPHEDLAKDLPPNCRFGLLGTLGMLNALLGSRHNSGHLGSKSTTVDLAVSDDEATQADDSTDDLVAKVCLEYLDTEVMYQDVADTDFHYGQGLEIGGNTLPFELQNPTISYIDATRETVTWLPDEEFDGTTTVGTATVEGEIEFEGYMFKGDLSLANDSPGVYVSNSDHNRHMAEVTCGSSFVAKLAVRIEMNGIPEVTELLSIELVE